MRFRLAKLVEKPENQPRVAIPNPYNRQTKYEPSDRKLRDSIEEEIGIPFSVRINGVNYQTWRTTFERMSIYQILDSVSVLYGSMLRNNCGENFIDQVRRVFREENMAYDFDDLGGAHPLVDTVYQGSFSATIKGLDGPRYEASRIDVESIDKHLLAEPPDFRQAIRSVFSANENLFKMMYEGTRQLNTRSVKEKLMSDIQSFYADQETVKITSQKNLEGFTDWIDAAHFYRHEQGKPLPNQPTEELALLMISHGLTFLRWLVAFDRKKLA